MSVQWHDAGDARAQHRASCALSSSGTYMTYEVVLWATSGYKVVMNEALGINLKQTNTQ